MKKQSKFSKLQLRSTDDVNLNDSIRSTDSELTSMNLLVTKNILNDFETIDEFNYSEENFGKLQPSNNTTLDDFDFKNVTENKTNVTNVLKKKKTRKKVLRKSIQKNKLTFNPISVNPKELDVNAEHLELAIALSKSVAEYENFQTKSSVSDENHMLDNSFSTFNTKGKIANVRSTLERFGFKSNRKITNATFLKGEILFKSKFHNKSSKLYLRSQEEREKIITDKVKGIIEKCIENNSKREKVNIFPVEKYISIVEDLNSFCYFPSKIYCSNHLTLEELHNDMFYIDIIPKEDRIEVKKVKENKEIERMIEKPQNSIKNLQLNRSISPELFSESESDTSDDKEVQKEENSKDNSVLPKISPYSEIIETENGICLYESYCDLQLKHEMIEENYSVFCNETATSNINFELPNEFSECYDSCNRNSDFSNKSFKSIKIHSELSQSDENLNNTEMRNESFKECSPPPLRSDIWNETEAAECTKLLVEENCNKRSDSVCETNIDLTQSSNDSNSDLDSNDPMKLSDKSIDLTQSSDDEVPNVGFESNEEENAKSILSDLEELPEFDFIDKKSTSVNLQEQLNSSQLSQSSDILMDDELNYSCSTPYKNLPIKYSIENTSTGNVSKSDEQQFNSSTECERKKREAIEDIEETNSHIDLHMAHTQNVPLSHCLDNSLDEYLSREIEPDHVTTLETKLLLNKNKNMSSTNGDSMTSTDSSKLLHPRIAALATPKKCFPLEKLTNEIPNETMKQSEDENGPKTPEDDVILKVRCLTPMGNYQEMDTPNVLKELDKFGLKPLKRPHAVKILEHIYNVTHPSVASTTNTSEELVEEDMIIKKRKIDIPSTDTKYFYKPNEDHESIEIVGDDLLKNEKSEDLIFERKRSSKIHSCQLPFQIAWHNFLSVHKEVQENMLMYEPLQLEVLHDNFKELGFKYHIEDLLTFFDKKCVTIRTNQSHTKGKLRRHKSSGK